MAGFTSSDVDAVKAAYIANCDYDDGAGDVTKARAFKNACRKLLMMQPQLAMHTAAGGQHQVMIDTKVIPDELERVQDWLSIFDTALTAVSPSSTQLVLDEFRS